MQTEYFLSKCSSLRHKTGSISWQSPSNIALVKYWGKYEQQIPANPSLSLSLSNCNTQTTVHYELNGASDTFQFELFLDGRQEEAFRPKIQKFFELAFPYLPFLSKYKFQIHTRNTFPHSSGIASSASGMSALALCLVSLEREVTGMSADDFLIKSSFLARLGSGSACRSIYGNLVVWGEHSEISSSSDLYATPYPYPVHSCFDQLQDTVLLVDEGQKEVSSTIGHELMKNHPFAENRFDQARTNMSLLKDILQVGNYQAFIEIVEKEALSLHAMMMTSDPSFILMKPGTLEIIERIRWLRKSKSLHTCFTLDAGANVHLLYPAAEKEMVNQFIERELLTFCQNRKAIFDKVGTGPSEI